MDRRQRERFAAGDRAAVRALVETHGRAVFGVAYRVLGDAALAEDAVQLTLLSAWRNSHRYDPTRDLEPWLFTIARRAAIDVYRREQRHRGSGLADADIAVLPESLDDAWKSWQIHQALARLDEDEREIMRHTHFLGMSQSETAEALGIPLGTVKSRAHRAHRRLASMLDHLSEASA